MGDGGVRSAAGDPALVGGIERTDSSALAGHDRPEPDPARPTHLLADLDNDAEIVDQFVADFLALLDHRVGNARRLVEVGALDDAKSVLRSLATSAAMVGADELSTAAGTLVARIGLEPTHYLAEPFDTLEQAAAEARNRFQPLPPANR